MKLCVDSESRSACSVVLPRCMATCIASDVLMPAMAWSEILGSPKGSVSPSMLSSQAVSSSSRRNNCLHDWLWPLPYRSSQLKLRPRRRRSSISGDRRRMVRPPTVTDRCAVAPAIDVWPASLVAGGTVIAAVGVGRMPRPRPRDTCTASCSCRSKERARLIAISKYCGFCIWTSRLIGSWRPMVNSCTCWASLRGPARTRSSRKRS
uniref:Uncharacterized protein n=1 Tax=Arundo donax TaxID=35708 RepID=A0A0A9BVK9_ARUDO